LLITFVCAFTKRSHKIAYVNQGFSNFFCLMMEGSGDSYKIIPDPDGQEPQHCMKRRSAFLPLLKLSPGEKKFGGIGSEILPSRQPIFGKISP
jgi:hypothetical protein